MNMGTSDGEASDPITEEGPNFHKTYVDSYGLVDESAGRDGEQQDIDDFLASQQSSEDEEEKIKKDGNLYNNACFNDNYIVFSLKGVKLP
jgi:hypothetical protein